MIPLDDLRHAQDICEILDYPREDVGICIERMSMLKSMNIDAIVLEGDTLLRKHHVLGKGTNSIVVKLIYSGEYAVGKILRSDASRRSLKNEAEILKYINENMKKDDIRVSPKLYLYKDWILVIELINGVPIGEYLDSYIYSLPKSDVRMLLYNILFKAYYLDKIGVDHGELSNPHKHIYIIEEEFDAIIIDFESASLNRPTHNLTSVYQFIFRSSNAAEYLNTLFRIDYNNIIPLLKQYKSSKSYTNFIEILKYSNLID